MRPSNRYLTPPSCGMMHLRAMRANPGVGDLTDPFAVRPVRRSIMLMMLAMLPLLANVLLAHPVSPILLMVTLLPPFILWPYCLAVLALCGGERCAGWIRKQWWPAIEELEISPRLVRLLRRHGYGSIASVEQASDRALTLIPNLDERGLREIRRSIHLRNYRTWQASGFSSKNR